MALFTRLHVGIIAIALSLVVPSLALAFLNNGRWSTTATDGPTDPLGRPVTLTWSIVPDGTTINHLAKPSNLISVFDGIFPGSSDVPLVDKPWFALVKQCFDSWSEVSGITFVYEPIDDGLSGHPQGIWAGELGFRGDVRLAGAAIDGLGGTLAEAGFIPNADITIDTVETAYFGSDGGTFPYINLRTSLMHEIGHSLGLGHSNSNNSAFLMENFSQTSFDGPQIDDIRGAHYLYGDKYEKTNGGLGNEAFDTATLLGTIDVGQSVFIGDEGATGTVVLSSETDFLSIANSSDVDIFSFSIESPSIVDVVLTPVGATYHERGTINTSTVSNLTLELYAATDEAPQLLQSVNLNGVGQAESLLDLALSSAGAYFAKVAGNADAVQLYQLMLGVDSQFLLGDFNDDGVVDAADFTVWRDHMGDADESAILNRGDGLNGVDAEDFALWKAHFGETLEQGGGAAQSVPEPNLIASVLSLLVAAALACRKLNILPADSDALNRPISLTPTAAIIYT